MSGAESADHVSIHVTDCGHQDAGAVFRALESAFPEVEEPTRSEVQAATGAEHPMVWCMVVDTRTGHAPSTATPVPLSGGVSVDLFGAADPVRKVRQELAAAFSVEDRGTVPGEHELEVRLRLT
ncbi:hypothetical protein [Streptomyces albireticuli]|uniref:Uncharacterized protein n=1 Tax=Streptomyces albireticuli TaxID=1940 RepID=A0A2A2DC58_9ACTN|nr:hypothetical protein [Streptomyces albireticuli]MCD9143926.1 hypothetical protein [Streptomyces albireticuli]MCD9161643.1 hypothetical protein [Streptomyces albireticuli]MCD9192043.1 hypothetical protein [Streptomyces albireticuli]PAU49026.1 hypothetical protein CK936_10060 [Streptomyces albireticuli]